MQATITFCLTEAAQRAQMAATGTPVARKQTVVEDVPVELLSSPLCRVDEQGTVEFNLTANINLSEEGKIGGYGYAVIHSAFAAMPESGLVAIQDLAQRVADKSAKLATAYAESQAARKAREAEVAAENAAKAAKIDAARQAFLSDPAARAERIESYYFVFGDVRIDDYDTLQIARKRRDTDQETAETAKQQYIDAWIAALVVPPVWEVQSEPIRLVKQQHADGLLCRKAALELIADFVFTAAGVPEAAKVDTDFCDSSSCPCGSRDLDCLPRAQYPAWCTIRDSIATYLEAEGRPIDDFTVSFSRVRECARKLEECYDGEPAGPPIYLAEIGIQTGPFKFERTVRLD